jgi:hypothetical protein
MVCKIIKFNDGLIRLISQIMTRLLQKIQGKQHHYLYTKIVYNVIMTRGKVPYTNRGGKDVKFFQSGGKALRLNKSSTDNKRKEQYLTDSETSRQFWLTTTKKLKF